MVVSIEERLERLETVHNLREPERMVQKVELGLAETVDSALIRFGTRAAGVISFLTLTFVAIFVICFTFITHDATCKPNYGVFPLAGVAAGTYEGPQANATVFAGALSYSSAKTTRKMCQTREPKFSSFMPEYYDIIRKEALSQVKTKTEELGNAIDGVDQKVVQTVNGVLRSIAEPVNSLLGGIDNFLDTAESGLITPFREAEDFFKNVSDCAESPSKLASCASDIASKLGSKVVGVIQDGADCFGSVGNFGGCVGGLLGGGGRNLADGDRVLQFSEQVFGEVPQQAQQVVGEVLQIPEQDAEAHDDAAGNAEDSIQQLTAAYFAEVGRPISIDGMIASYPALVEGTFEVLKEVTPDRIEPNFNIDLSSEFNEAANRVANFIPTKNTVASLLDDVDSPWEDCVLPGWTCDDYEKDNPECGSNEGCDPSKECSAMVAYVTLTCPQLSDSVGPAFGFAASFQMFLVIILTTLYSLFWNKKPDEDQFEEVEA